MTTKLEGIPQWASDRATELYGEIGYTVGHKQPITSVIKSLARAILKAKNDAYDEASRVALSYGESGDPFVQFDSEEISQAIRNLKHETEV